MYDTVKIGIGLLVFLAIFLSPFAYNMTVGQEAELELETPSGSCIKDTEYMKANHMDLLDTWRNEVVRDNNRIKVKGIDGQEYEKSLTKTCLKCHDNKAEFCDKCHNYASVDPTCWDCHVDMGGVK